MRLPWLLSCSLHFFHFLYVLPRSGKELYLLLAARDLPPGFFASCSLRSREIKRNKRKKNFVAFLFSSFLSFPSVLCHAVARRFSLQFSATKWQGDFLFSSLPRSGKETFSSCSSTQWQGDSSSRSSRTSSHHQSSKQSKDEQAGNIA